jgi:hypothetical protein
MPYMRFEMSEKCSYCGSNSTLVKSHIIPQGLYWGLNQSKLDEDIVHCGKTCKRQGDEHKSPVVVSTLENEYKKSRPNGIWDRFLCQRDEDRFNDWDTHAIEVLRDYEPQVIAGGWQYQGFDYTKLKLFFLSLLWRAHATTNPFFEPVSLGVDADRIKRFIDKQDPGNMDDYAVMLWRSEELIAKAVIPPSRERQCGVTFMRFYLPGYMALIKVDQHSLPRQYQNVALSDLGSWIVSRKDYAREGEGRTMFNVAREAN